MASALELPFRVDVGAMASVGINQRGVQHEPVSIWEDQVFGEDGDGGLAGNAARFIRFRDAALDGSADGNHGFAVHNDRGGDSCREWISGFRTEGCKRGFEFHLDSGSGGQGSLRTREACDQDERCQRKSFSHVIYYLQNSIGYLLPRSWDNLRNLNHKGHEVTRRKSLRPRRWWHFVSLVVHGCSASCRETDSLPFQSSNNFIQRGAIELVIAAIDVAHRAAAVVVATNYEGGRVRDVECIGAERVMEPVGFGHGPILIQQKDAGDGMLLQEFSRFPHAVPLFGGDECQRCSGSFNFLSPRLELSHALHAVWSPGATQKLENQRALREQSAESECALAIGRSQGKIRGARTDL